MKKEIIIDKIIEYFNDNEEIYNCCIEELDAYNGYLGDDRYFSMDELNEFFIGASPLEIIDRVYYGRDNDTWTVDGSGNKSYGEFNPNREYFYFNGYGNLVSSDYKDYSSQLDKWLIESLSDNRLYIDSIIDNDELTQLFDELEEA